MKPARVGPRFLAFLVSTILAVAHVKAFSQEVTDASLPKLSSPGVLQNGPDAVTGRPSYGILRQDEDWSALADPSRRTDPLDTLKFIPLSKDGSTFLITAVDAYVSYRGFRNQGNGIFPGYDGTLNTRGNLHLALTLGERFRLYGALKHGNQYFSSTPPLTINQNRLDLHQAFVEASLGDLFGEGRSDLLVRVGRQEIHYGNGALISARLGPNVRSDYDGVLVRAHFGRVLSDAFVYQAVVDRPGIFDDRRDRQNTIWGSYSTIETRRLNVDLIYVGQHRGNQAYAFLPNPVNETRHTGGVRFWNARPLWGKLIADVELDFQAGTARRITDQPLSIRAWNVLGTLSHPVKSLVLQPTFGFEFGVNSGNQNPNDNTLGTFRSPDPPGRYFGEANEFGPGNISGARPYIEIHPTKALRIRPKATFFLRTTTTDGTYTRAPSVLRGTQGNAHFLGAEPGLEAEYTFNPHFFLTGFLAYFQNSAYFAANPPNRNITYVEMTLSFRL